MSMTDPPPSAEEAQPSASVETSRNVQEETAGAEELPIHANVAKLVYPAERSQTAFIISVLWAIVAVILGVVLLVSAKDVEYGADAYTGIQNGIMLAVRGIAFLLFGSGALGVVIATTRSRSI